MEAEPILRWGRATEKQFLAFRRGLVAKPFWQTFQLRKPVRGYLIVVNKGHDFCQCQRQVIIRAAHPENLPGLYPLSRANERSTAEDYLRKQGLNVPQPFPDALYGWWWENIVTSPIEVMSSDSDSDPAFKDSAPYPGGVSQPASSSDARSF